MTLKFQVERIYPDKKVISVEVSVANVVGNEVNI